jgi:hypothetical protein
MPTAIISETASGDQEIIAAPGAGRFIIVDGWQLMCAAEVVLTWKSGSTALTGPMAFGDNTGFGCLPGKVPYFMCAANEALNLNLSGTSQVGGVVQYSVGGIGSLGA